MEVEIKRVYAYRDLPDVAVGGVVSTETHDKEARRLLDLEVGAK